MSAHSPHLFTHGPQKGENLKEVRLITLYFTVIFNVGFTISVHGRNKTNREEVDFQPPFYKREKNVVPFSASQRPNGVRVKDGLMLSLSVVRSSLTLELGL